MQYLPEKYFIFFLENLLISIEIVLIKYRLNKVFFSYENAFLVFLNDDNIKKFKIQTSYVFMLFSPVLQKQARIFLPRSEGLFIFFILMYIFF